jgi:alkylhydroperoxidase/carboxymuconolactone decarboxylase family protein YurZ
VAGAGINGLVAAAELAIGGWRVALVDANDRLGPVYAEEVFLAAGGPAWYHPAITDRERYLVIITALTAQGVVGSDRLDSHIQQALRAGVDYESLAAMMTLVTNYIGQTYGSQAMQAVQRLADSNSPTSAPDS